MGHINFSRKAYLINLPNFKGAVTMPTISKFPVLINTEGEEPRQPRYKWLLPLCNWVGITMTSTEHPRGWQWNPATVTLFVVVLGMIAVGFYWMGQRDSETRQLLDRLERIEKTAQQAKELSIAGAAGAGHEKPTPTQK